MTYAQIIEKRNRLMAEAGAIAQGKSVTPEQRAKVTAMLAEADTLSEDARIANALEDHAAEIRSAGAPPRGAIEGNTQIEQEKRAFRDWMRTGVISAENRSYLRETRNLGATVGVGVGSNTISSSVLIPVGFDPELAVAQKSYGQLVGAVRRLVTSDGQPLKVSLEDDTENALSVIAEDTAVSETDPNLSGFVSYVDELTTGLVRVGNSLLADSAYSVSEFIQSTFGTRYYKGLAQMIQQGNGSHIASIAANVPVSVTTASPTAPVLSELIQTFAALDPAYLDRSSWLMAPSTKAALMQMTDSLGRSLLQADATGQPFNSLYGRPIVSSTYAPTIAAGNVPIIFGDLTSYTLRTVGSLEIVRLSERYAEFNSTGFIGRCRAGGYSTLQTASPALVSLKMHS